MKRYFYTLFFLLLITGACRKDTFPDEFSIYGRWKEYTNNTERTEIEFKRDNDLLLKLVNDTIRNYKYLLNKPNELEIFTLVEFPDGKRSTHKVTYNSKDEQMTIYGLYPVAPENPLSTVFIRR